MSTVADLISGALRALGVLASGEAPTANEQTDAFNSLNDMLDSWANERLTLYATVRASYALIPNHNPHTIGTEGSPDFSATRPIRIDRASLVLASSGNAELPIKVQSDHEWQITQGKVTTGMPVFLWYDSQYPLANIWLQPVPVEADTLVLYCWQQLGRFASVNTTVDMPPGYLRALRFNLAKELAMEYGKSLSPEAVQAADDSLAAIKRGNAKPDYLLSDSALLRRGPFNIISGDR